MLLKLRIGLIEVDGFNRIKSSSEFENENEKLISFHQSV